MLAQGLTPQEQVAIIGLSERCFELFPKVIGQFNGWTPFQVDNEEEQVMRKRATRAIVEAVCVMKERGISLLGQEDSGILANDEFFTWCHFLFHSASRDAHEASYNEHMRLLMLTETLINSKQYWWHCFVESQKHLQRWSYHSNELLRHSALANAEENNVIPVDADDFQQTQIVTHHQDNTFETQEGISFSPVVNELSAEEEKQEEEGRFSIGFIFSPTWQTINNSPVGSIPVRSPVFF
ncbi:hypothetical protein [Coxiella burnetii]|uniref:hypothetical protein n=1 Tax=Coxiella burnetii TaxID=777 RepID=UPI0002E91FB8|nr:hypothetical protein [Coxiella burnetii]